jgi:hypothetical protein
VSFIRLIGRLQVALCLSVVGHQRERFRFRIRENIDYPLAENSSMNDMNDLRRSTSHKSNLDKTSLSKSGT